MDVDTAARIRLHGESRAQRQRPQPRAAEIKETRPNKNTFKTSYNIGGLACAQITVLRICEIHPHTALEEIAAGRVISISRIEHRICRPDRAVRAPDQNRVTSTRTLSHRRRSIFKAGTGDQNPKNPPKSGDGGAGNVASRQFVNRTYSSSF